MKRGYKRENHARLHDRGNMWAHWAHETACSYAWYAHKSEEVSDSFNLKLRQS